MKTIVDTSGLSGENIFDPLKEVDFVSILSPKLFVSKMYQKVVTFSIKLFKSEKIIANAKKDMNPILMVLVGHLYHVILYV